MGTGEATFGKFCQQKEISNPFHNVSYNLVHYVQIKIGAIMIVNCFHVDISVTRISFLMKRNSYVLCDAASLLCLFLYMW